MSAIKVKVKDDDPTQLPDDELIQVLASLDEEELVDLEEPSAETIESTS